MSWDGFEFVRSFETVSNAPIAVALDNFSEDEHFPYVHRLFGWDEAGWGEVEHSATVQGDQLTVHYAGSQRSSYWLPLMGVKAGDRFHNDWITRFDPVRATFTFHWFDPKTSTERPLVTRAVIYIIPETDATTRLRTFLFMKLGNPLLRLARPLVHRIASSIARNEIDRDARFLPCVAHTSESLEGMRLGKYDKGVIAGRKLLDRIYFGREASTERDLPATTSSS
jgi:hypothetical protein